MPEPDKAGRGIADDATTVSAVRFINRRRR